jgi:hypothetical protein
MTILDQWSVKFQPDAEPVASVVSGEIHFDSGRLRAF